MYRVSVDTKSIQILQNNAELAVQDMLIEIARKTKQRTGTTSLYAEEFMDDGANIRLRVDIDESTVSWNWCYLLILQLLNTFAASILLRNKYQYLNDSDMFDELTSKCCHTIFLHLISMQMSAKFTNAHVMTNDTFSFGICLHFNRSQILDK